MQLPLVLWCGVGYLCGSISFALILGRLNGIDIRQVGSGNVGATNVGRILGKKWGILCFLLDVLKGAAPTLAAGLGLGFVGQDSLSQEQAWQWLAVGAAAMIGHISPVWLKLRGGKGVATGFGVLLGVWPHLTSAGLSGLVVWLVLAGTFRYVGVASVLAALSLPCFVWFWATVLDHDVRELGPFFAVTGAMGLLVLVRHRGNLLRTWQGSEPKLGVKAVLPSDALSSDADSGDSAGSMENRD